MVRIKIVSNATEAEPARDLFHEYRLSVGDNRCFRDFTAELDGLPGPYTLPEGILLLAYVNQNPAACIAVRPFSFQAGTTDCELRRLYVRMEYRGLMLGRLMAESALQHAAGMGYRRIVLETLDSMSTAQALYRSLGFAELPNDRAAAGMRFMQLDLKTA